MSINLHNPLTNDNLFFSVGISKYRGRLRPACPVMAAKGGDKLFKPFSRLDWPGYREDRGAPIAC